MSTTAERKTVHWLGAGLSSVPGIRRLANSSLELKLWNRSLDKAEKAVKGLEQKTSIQQFDLAVLVDVVQAGDIVVSMLPGSFHPQIARLCLDQKAHFVSSSYISPEVAALDAEARNLNLCLLNEVGLDPGLDHLMAHLLVSAYRDATQFDPDNELLFRSYCGGFPAKPNDFRYKFSWSPLGVLKALMSPSKSMSDGKILDVERPWQSITIYPATLPGSRRENFEAYPNRDALPFIAAYGFEENWKVEEFVRGTLRLDGWAKAWKTIFEEIESLEGEAGNLRLQELSAELWQENPYDEDEADRVVLCVELEARKNNVAVWHQGYSIDAYGNNTGSAMARLVSLTVSLAVEALAEGNIPMGVSAAPSEPGLIGEWFKTLGELGEHIERIDYLEG